MKPIFLLIFFAFLFLSCKKSVEKEKIEMNKSEKYPVFVKLGLYPSFAQPAEIMVNLNEQYILLYNASPYVYGSLNMDSQKNNEIANKQFSLVSDSLKYGITPFYATLSKEELLKIKSKIISFTEEDFNPDLYTGINDGMGYHFQILYSNHILKEINPLNFPSKNQFELSKLLIDMVEYKNQNTTNKSILLTIKEYQDFIEDKYEEKKD